MFSICAPLCGSGGYFYANGANSCGRFLEVADHGGRRKLGQGFKAVRLCAAEPSSHQNSTFRSRRIRISDISGRRIIAFFGWWVSLLKRR